MQFRFHDHFCIMYFLVIPSIHVEFHAGRLLQTLEEDDNNKRGISIIKARFQVLAIDAANRW